MQILKNKKVSVIVTVISLIFFLTENSMNMSPIIRIVINILLIILMATTNIMSRDKNKCEPDQLKIKVIRAIGIIVFVICFLGVFILKKAGVI